MKNARMDRRVTVRLSDGMYDAVVRMAAEHGGNFSEVIRPMFAEAISRRADNPFLDRELMAHAANIIAVVNEIISQSNLLEQEHQGFTDTTGEFVLHLRRLSNLSAQGIRTLFELLLGEQEGESDKE